MHLLADHGLGADLDDALVAADLRPVRRPRRSGRSGSGPAPDLQLQPRAEEDHAVGLPAAARAGQEPAAEEAQQQARVLGVSIPWAAAKRSAASAERCGALPGVAVAGSRSGVSSGVARRPLRRLRCAHGADHRLAARRSIGLAPPVALPYPPPDERRRQTSPSASSTGDKRALARAISLIENGDPEGAELVADVYPRTGVGADRRLHRAARGRQEHADRRPGQGAAAPRAPGRRCSRSTPRARSRGAPCSATGSASPSTSSTTASSSARWRAAAPSAGSPRRRCRRRW